LNGWIGISLGDVTGIGPEVTLKALAASLAGDTTRYLIVGDKEHVRRLDHQLGLRLPLTDFAGPHQPGRIFLVQPQPEALPAGLAPGSPLAARAAVAWLVEAAQRCRRGEVDALVTAPVNKEAIIRSGVPFVGQTELLSELAGTRRTVMMLLGCDDRDRWLRVALVTTHLPIRDVADQITREKVELAIERAVGACQALGLRRARVGVCGLNPHAGEGGKIGDEEIKVIRPAVAAAQQKHGDVHGPMAADALFHQAFQGDYDAVVAMYHDQGLAPLKMIAFETGVNWTLGLPFIRTSPDHGTAYDIAGQNRANPSSMVAALTLARRLAQGK
jgi:4-hydroxythreonine-4-phosphate dehydrogenase